MYHINNSIRVLHSTNNKFSRLEIIKGVNPQVVFTERSLENSPKLISINLLNGASIPIQEKLIKHLLKAASLFIQSKEHSLFNQWCGFISCNRGI